MSVVGIDLGSLNSVIAVARSGGVDVICNEVSDRATPSMVSFDKTRRYIGDAARTQQVGNFRNTVAALPRLIGKKNETKQALIEESFLTCQLSEKDGRIAATVSYQDEEHQFTDIELLGMLLGKLRSITINETKASALDCVLSVPGYFGEFERRAVLDAAQISGLNCLSLINDSTAIALCYGLTRADIQDDTNVRNVCFVDIGYSNTQICIVGFGKGSLEVRSYAYDANLGGRDFDEALAQYFADAILAKYKQDACRQSKKSMLRLRVACEKIKKVLSGIAFTRLELESLFDGIDVPLEMSREQFNELTQGLVGRVEACIHAAITSSGLSINQIFSCEIVGGTTRIPAIKDMLSRIFGKEPSTTLNQDEAIARGCAFKCAFESPSVRVRPYSIKDFTSKSFNLLISSPERNGETIEHVQNASIPWNKSLMLSDSFPIKLEYQCEGQVVSSFVLPSQNRPSGSTLQVHVSITAHEISAITKVVAIEEKTEISNAETGETRKIVREYPLKWEASNASLNSKSLQALKDQEFQLALNDKHASELDDSRNAVEEYIYEMREKIQGEMRQFVSDKDAQLIIEKLDQSESWLYSDDEGDSGKPRSKDVYVKKLGELRHLCSPAIVRSNEHVQRPKAANALREMASLLIEKAAKANLEEEDRLKIINECNGRLEWLEAQLSQANSIPLHADVSITAAAINEQREKMIKATSTLFTKEKKEVPQEKTPAPSESTTESTSTDEIPNMEVD